MGVAPDQLRTLHAANRRSDSPESAGQMQAVLICAGARTGANLRVSESAMRPAKAYYVLRRPGRATGD